MKPESRYRYEKRIEELEAKVARLEPYRQTLIEIYEAIADQVHKGETLSMGWMLKRIRWVFK